MDEDDHSLTFNWLSQDITGETEISLERMWGRQVYTVKRFGLLQLWSTELHSCCVHDTWTAYNLNQSVVKWLFQIVYLIELCNQWKLYQLFAKLVATAYKSALMVRLLFHISLYLPLEESLGCMFMVEMPGL